VIGLVLAGGRARRMGGEPKAALALGGRPLLARPLEAMAPVCDRLAVVCKPHTLLPTLPDGVERWDEPAERVHPLAGLAFGLQRAGEEALVCAADMPFVDGALFEAIKEVAGGRPGAAAVLAEAGGRLEPLLGVYRPAALGALRDAAHDARLTDVAEGLEPVRVAMPAEAVRSLNTPEDLAGAEAELAG
jgi:molybdopterin-guanine dinucleotide biosynthesis protein A